MQSSSLLQSSGAVANAQIDSAVAPRSSDPTEMPEKRGFQAIMEEGDQRGMEQETVDDGTFVLELGGAVPAAVKSIAQADAFISLQDVQLGDRDADAASGATEGASDKVVAIEEGPLVEDSTSDIEAVQMFYMTSEHKPIFVESTAPKLDSSLIDTSHAASAKVEFLGVESATSRGPSQVDQNLALNASLDIESVLMPTVLPPRDLTDGGNDISATIDTVETPLLAKTLGEGLVDIKPRAGTLIDPITYNMRKPESVSVSQTVILNQNAAVLIQPLQRNSEGAGLGEAGPLSAIAGHREALASGSDSALNQQNTPRPQSQAPDASQGAAALHALNSKAEVLGATQQANDSSGLDDGGDSEVASIDASAADSSIEPTGVQTQSAPTAAERSAALYSGMTESTTIQTISDTGSRAQDFEMTSFYGGADSLSDQLSQADPLTQASRVELPARLAAQIADVAKQLPDGPIEISLSPEELGKVKLTFQVSENGAMNVVVAAERAETLEFMRRNIDSLLAEFSDLGYEGSSFQFQQDDQDGSDQSGSGRSSGTIESAESAQAVQSDTKLSSPVRLHLDGTAGMDLRL